MIGKGFAQIQFGYGSSFNYLKGIDAVNLSADWYKRDFDDSGWLTGNAPLRYGKGTGGTQFSDMRNSYSTIYLRSTFTAQSVGNIKKMKFTSNFDDGFVIWINGIEILRQNAPDNLSYNSLALTTHEFNVAYTAQINPLDIQLEEGSNVIAVQIFNSTLGSSDIYFDMGIEATPELPPLIIQGDGVSFSNEAGFYTNPFDLTMTSSDPTCKIVYTIDGSNPVSSSTRIVGGTSEIIRIDPDITAERGKTPAFVVRASLTKEGFSATFPISKTFIFIDKVKTQTQPGGEWPGFFVNNQIIDYDMAGDIVNDNRYKNQISAALLEIPTISISTDLDNLFGSNDGIYVNAAQKGTDWERDCSVELINPNGEKGFQINAGIRIRGGNSAKNGMNPKHAFRLFFREEYGTKKLKYPLFGDTGASEFKCIDLRCEQNYSWNMDGDPHNTMVKDIFCRDLQGLMGQPYARGNQYHLYIDGMYWGIFQTDERPEASFAESYLGGDKSDYDVIKVTTIPWPYYDVYTDGSMDSWEKVWNMCQKGFDTNEKYFLLEGKNADGIRNDTSTVWVDIDNLIDYMMVIFYSGNYDAPVSAWGGNDMPNNFFAIFNRENKSLGYKFVAHDSEHCLFVDGVNIGVGLEENRVNIGTNGKMKINRLLDFNPQWLHYKLSFNEEYRLRFADRASKYLSEGGLLSPERTEQLFQKRASEIDTAIIAESARWGDAQSNTSLNKDDDWLPEINNLYDNYFPYRTDIVIQQLKDEDLYSNYKAPVVSVSGEIISEEKYLFSGNTNVNILNTNSSGEIFYTINGNDPRIIGGSISDKAIQGGKSVNISLSSTTIVYARVKNGIEWGPLRKVNFMKEHEDYSKLKVTELSYHPLDQVTGTDTIDDKNFEFIEFKNTGSANIDISGLKLDSAVNFTIPENTILPPADFYVVASKPNSFFERYGVYPSGNFKGQLSNSREYILLTDRNGIEILSFTWSDKSPWPEEPDGNGYTLTSVEANPTGDPNSYQYWKHSAALNGSPFKNDNGTTAVEDYVSNVSNFELAVYPNPASEYITVELKSGSNSERINIFIMDVNGRMIYKKAIIGTETINLKELNLKPGFFILKAESSHMLISRKLVFTSLIK
jgi:hypothetical protein